MVLGFEAAGAERPGDFAVVVEQQPVMIRAAPSMATSDNGFRYVRIGCLASDSGDLSHGWFLRAGRHSHYVGEDRGVKHPRAPPNSRIRRH